MDLNTSDSDAAFDSATAKKNWCDSYRMQGLLLSWCPPMITLKSVR